MSNDDVTIESVIRKSGTLVHALAEIARSASPILGKLTLASLDAAVHLQKELIEVNNLILFGYSGECEDVSDPIIARRSWDSTSVTPVDLENILTASDIADSLCGDLGTLAHDGRPLFHELLSRYSVNVSTIRANMIKIEQGVRMELKLDSHAKLQPKSYRC